MLNLIAHLKTHKMAINLNIDNVFLTLKGIPCISHHHIYSTDNSISCCQDEMTQLLAKIVMELALQKPLSENY
jgi:hypothetical protein